MKKLIIPDSKLITTTAYSDLADFDLSYSEQIKEFLAEQIDIDINLLKDLKCAFFTNYIKISDTFSKPSGPFQLKMAGAFRPSDNLLLISIDDYFNEDERMFAIVHEVGHSLSLIYLSVSIAEACAVSYERKWAQKNNKIDKFNSKYNPKSIETYYYSLKLLDMISESVFNNNSEEIQRCTKRGAHDDFTNKIDNYLNFIGCNITAKELLLLVDVAFYNRIDQYMSRSFKEKPPYFFRIFDELHHDILPVIFDKNSSKEQISNINNRLLKYKEIITLSFHLLESISNSSSYKDFSTFMRLYKQKLAKKFKELDVKEYFHGSLSDDELSSAIRNSIITAFEDTSNIYSQYQDLSSKNKRI